MRLNELVEKQQEYFKTGETKNVSFRIYALKKLKAEIQSREHAIMRALHADLNKAPFEAYMTEYGLVLSEIDYALKHMKKWTRRRNVSTPIVHFLSKSFIMPEPYGNVLIMSPWNFPFLLSLMPLVGAIAAGNCTIIKPSDYSRATTEIICEIIDAGFSQNFIAVVKGGREENSQLLEQKFDYIFFTGSETVGKIVMTSAAKNLTPFTLELGGKSPCIIDTKTNIKLAAKRVVFGKFINAGQTCIAPDYLLIHHSMQDEFIEAMAAAVFEFFGENPLEYPDFPKIINDKHFERLLGLVQNQSVAFGGTSNKDTLKISPTVLRDVLPGSPIMQEEIFGPVLPVLTYDNIEDAIEYINGRAKPLALYIFSDDKKIQNMVLNSCSFGGGCINDTLMQIGSSKMPFGGVGASGMGHYHGKYSFDTFSHKKAILKKYTLLDLPVRYHPYSKFKNKLLRIFFR